MKNFILPLFLMSGFLTAMQSEPCPKPIEYSDHKILKKAIQPHRGPGYHKSVEIEPVHTTCLECDLNQGLENHFDAIMHLTSAHNAQVDASEWVANTYWKILYRLPVTQP